MALESIDLGTVRSSQKKGRSTPRARSVPHRRVFAITVIFSAAHYLGIIATLTTLAVFFHQPSALAPKVLIICLIYCAISWLIAFFRRRQTHCPLCKGTPLINSGALPHQKAVRCFPLNHGVTATLSIILFQKFRCMFCGTLFDMLKPLANETPTGREKLENTYTSYKQDPP